MPPFSNLSCPIPTQPLLHMVQQVADWVAPFPVVSIPLSFSPLCARALGAIIVIWHNWSNYALNSSETIGKHGKKITFFLYLWSILFTIIMYFGSNLGKKCLAQKIRNVLTLCHKTAHHYVKFCHELFLVDDNPGLPAPCHLKKMGFWDHFK